LLAEPQTRTDEGGRFELQAPAVPVPDQPLEQLLIAQKGMAAFARAPGFATKGGKTAAQGQPTARAPVTELGDLVLADGVRLFGRVRDPQGKPLAGARILARDMLDQHRVLPGPRLDHLCHAVSNDSGIFELPCTLAQALSLDVSLPGHLRSAIEPVAVGAPLEIMLAPSGSIRGRVLDQDGRRTTNAAGRSPTRAPSRTAASSCRSSTRPATG
jgi:hypothetical protein